MKQINESEISVRWNQRFLYLFWFWIGLYLVLAFVGGLMTSPERRTNLLIHTMLEPGIILLILMLVVQAFSKRFPQKMPLFLVAATYISVYVIANALYELMSPVAALVLPMMFSSIYLSKRVMAAATGISLLELIVLYVHVYHPQHTMSSMDLLVMIGVLTSASGVGLFIVARSQELRKALVRNVEAKQELLLQNVWMQRMSKLDPLTELYNRAAFEDHINRVVEMCNQHDMPLHLAVIDVDDFKAINDTFGHDVGDMVLKELAKYMLNSLPEQFFLARYGGEEFVVVAAEVSAESFNGSMEDLRKHVSSKLLAGQSMTISIGVHSHSPGESAEAFFRLADQGLYWSKNHGKNRVGLSPFPQDVNMLQDAN